MSLFGSIQMAGNSLRANDVALQVVGQNISNANTPGYIREEVVLKPAATQKVGGLLLGMGVEIEAIVQKVDKFLDERLRGAVSDSANTDVLQQTYAQLEGLLGALSDTDLSTSMNNFFNSISDILNSPADETVRNQSRLLGQTLANDVQQMSQRVDSLSSDLNNRVQNMAGSINLLTSQIANLNVKITEMQGGAVSKSDAVGLTDQRSNALEELAGLINIRTMQQADGTITVYCGSDYLVFGGESRQVVAAVDANSITPKYEIQMADSASKLECSSGELYGLLESRDKVLGGFSDQLDDFAQTLTFEFNKIYASGQGLHGYSKLTSAYTVDDSSKPLNDAGLTFTPQNGSFQVLVKNKKTGLTTTSDVLVDLNGLGHDMTLDDLKAALDKVDGIQTEILVGGGFKIESKSADNEFSFANDTSGVLAALGLNVFFTGTSARDLGVSSTVIADPATFAASRGGIGADTDNAATMAQFLNYPIQSHNGETFGNLYDNITAEVTQGSSVAKTLADGAQTFETSLSGQKMSISGVNLDEEAVKMITFQRSYQASAKYISTITDLLQILVSI